MWWWTKHCSSKERVDNTLMEYHTSFEDAMASGGALPIQADLLFDFDRLADSWKQLQLFTFQTLTHVDKW